MNNDFLKIKETINSIPAKLEKPDCKPEIFWQHYPYLNIYGVATGGNSSNEYVDLGLPSGILWASKNIGASVPEETGYYFAWGEVTEQQSGEYSWTSYKYGSNWNNLTKYITKTGYTGEIDNLTELEPDDDAAQVNCGSNWIMPTSAMVQELIDNTTSAWTTQNGVNGVLLTSNINNNTMFLPAAGYKSEFTTDSVGNWGYYWSSSLHTDYPNYARCFCFYSDEVSLNDDGRCYGYSVRPVYKS